MGSYDGSDFSDIADESRIEEVAREEIFAQSIRFQTEWQDRLRDAGWVNTGEGINSITIDPQREGADDYRIGSDKVQILVSEFGRRPGAGEPPFSDIADWTNEQTGLPNRGDDDFVTVVNNIREAINERGIEPIGAGREAWMAVEDEYAEAVEDRLSEE